MKHKIKRILGIIVSISILLNSYGNAYASSSISAKQEGITTIVTAKTYIVDKNNIGGKGCNDAWAGTLTQPLCTINKGITLLQPSDTLFVRKGSYPAFSISKSGAAGKYITISGYNNEMPLISGGKGIELKGTWYIVIRGFEVTGATGNWTGAISVTNTSKTAPFYNIIENNKVHHNTYTNMSGIQISEGSYNKILNNEVYNNYFVGIRVAGSSSSITNNEIGFNHVYNHTLAGDDSDGISLYGTTVTQTYIHDNIAHDNSDDGIDTWNSSRNIVTGNISYNHNGVGDGNGFKMGGVNGGYNIVKNNIAYNNKARGFDSNGSGGNSYYNNIAYNNAGYGFQDAWRRDGSCTASKCPGVFINNIGYNNTKGNFSAGPSTLTSHNNIWYSDSGSPKAAYNANVYSSLTAFYSASGNRLDNPNAGDLSSLQTNPKFVNPAIIQFDLLPSSPAIDKGDPSNPGQTTAINRVDIGAIEYGSNSVLVTSVTRANTDPANTASVNFRVEFSKRVAGVDLGDFSLTTSDILNATVSGIGGSGNTYTVTVNTGTGNGSIQLNVIDNDSIKDMGLKPLGGAGVGNGSFTNGEIYTIDKSPVLPSPWVGSIAITSDKNIASVARPHIGAEIASYDGFSSGTLTAYIPMLFKDAFGGSYDSAFYIQNVNATNTANLTIQYYDSAGNLNCTITDTVTPLASKGYWVPSQSCLPANWVGGAVVTSDQPIVANGRPHIGAEVMTYNGFSSGSLASYIPMLFKDAFGGSYDAAFYIQNVHAVNTANITIEYYDSNGALSCTVSDTLAAFASKGYWVPGESCLPTGWVGGAVVTSDQPIVTVGRLHIGAQITTYNGFSDGASSSYFPMLFKGAYGGTHDAAFYIQNIDPSNTANLTINYYDSTGELTCAVNDTITPLASKGYWTPSQTCLPKDWIGGVIVTSDQPIVGVGRPHISDQITTYNGFTSGSASTFLPMLFKEAFGGSYNSAYYIQNTEASTASITIKFYDSTGLLTCSRTNKIPAHSILEIWVPSVTCTP